MRDFDDRVALLEEHVVIERPSADEYLARAEDALAKGDLGEATHCVNMAKIGRGLDELHELLDEMEDDDGC